MHVGTLATGETTMKSIAIAIAAALALAAAPAIAQPPTEAPTAPAAAKVSVETTKINQIIADPAAKATLEKAMPDIAQFYGMIGDMTLTEVMPLSDGQITPELLAALQAEFDKL